MVSAEITKGTKSCLLNKVLLLHLAVNSLFLQVQRVMYQHLLVIKGPAVNYKVRLLKCIFKLSNAVLNFLYIFHVLCVFLLGSKSDASDLDSNAESSKLCIRFVFCLIFWFYPVKPPVIFNACSKNISYNVSNRLSLFSFSRVKQHYSSDDLYKPRPPLRLTSKRAKAVTEQNGLL